MNAMIGEVFEQHFASRLMFHRTSKVPLLTAALDPSAEEDIPGSREETCDDRAQDHGGKHRRFNGLRKLGKDIHKFVTRKRNTIEADAYGVGA